ncbi:toll/interleukin-1 receptor domain-containing protein (plasmid) [Acaryochloris sp. CCMEE 5410]|nr:toll/interleukin-1 receptor domain-containing protein [Acaryochloris sp. CCMEE 5410]
MQINSSNKVFLSHKGVDKKKVIDFKETLKLLGYDPWIDDDAMPAGTTLERALLQGMQDSCGVVFFITPDFKDEGFLETEVNYAIQEKRKKKEKFAIIALLFQDKEGKKGEIPELLKSYVWKKPKSSLEAFREIIRALPIKPKHIDWRDEIPGVVTTPLAKSNKTELSDEAKIILKEAAKGNTDIFYLKDLNHISLSTNGKEFFTDQDNRTRALWEGGLEDLKRRRLIIEKPNTNGQYLTLTREGFKAADELAKDNV